MVLEVRTHGRSYIGSFPTKLPVIIIYSHICIIYRVMCGYLMILIPKVRRIIGWNCTMGRYMPKSARTDRCKGRVFPEALATVEKTS